MGVQLSTNEGGRVYLENPKEQLMQMLIKKTLVVNHALSFKEASEDPKMVSPNSYAFYYGSFREAAMIAWKKVQNLQKKESDTVEQEAAVTLKNQEDPQKSRCFASESCLNAKSNDLSTKLTSIDANTTATSKKATEHQIDKSFANNAYRGKVYKFSPSPRKYSYEDVKEMVVDYYKKHGKLPSEKDARQKSNLPSPRTLYKILGKKAEWEEIIASEISKKTASLVNDDN